MTVDSNSVLEIVTLGSPNAHVLRQVAAPVTFPLSVEDQNIIQLMKEKLLNIKGVGLAAPQLGVSKQIIVYLIEDNALKLRKQLGQESLPLTVLINPRYTAMAGTGMTADWEACFSVDEVTGKVRRYDNIMYSAQDEQGKQVNAMASGLAARVLQHEIDHVQGILFVDRLTPECLQGHPSEMIRLRVSEMDPSQRAAVSTMLKQLEENVDPNDKAGIERLAQWRKALVEADK